MKKKANLLHYIGIVMVFAGWYLLLCAKPHEGFSLLALGCGAGHLGCEYNDVMARQKEDKDEK